MTRTGCDLRVYESAAVLVFGRAAAFREVPGISLHRARERTQHRAVVKVRLKVLTQLLWKQNNELRRGIAYMIVSL